jgi:hypothetical protein
VPDLSLSKTSKMMSTIDSFSCVREPVGGGGGGQGKERRGRESREGEEEEFHMQTHGALL